MRRRQRVDDGTEATESKFYIPAGSAGPLVVDRLEQIWTALFDHRVDKPR